MVCIHKKVGQVLKLIFCGGILQEKKIIYIFIYIYIQLYLTLTLSRGMRMEVV